LVSIIIINFNTAQLTIQAIESIEKQVLSIEKHEVIVVDNASRNDDFENLKSGISSFSKARIKLIRSRINVGFGAGNMIGVQAASGDFYAFMNSDVLLTDDSISKIVSFLDQNPDASMAGCQAVDENGKKYKAFDYSLSLASELLSHSFLNKINPGKFPSRMRTANAPLNVGAVPGSLFVSRADDFDAVGGFDTNIFLYFEEKDLAYRIKKQLKKNIYSLPDTTYIHLKGKSTGASQIIRNEMKISQFYVIHKNLGALPYFIFYMVNFLIFLVKSPFNNKNRNYLLLLLGGISVAKSMKHNQKILS